MSSKHYLASQLRLHGTDRGLDSADILADPTVGGTVFVPNDAAFEDAAAAMNMSLAELLESPVMLPILLYHVVPITFLVHPSTFITHAHGHCFALHLKPHHLCLC